MSRCSPVDGAARGRRPAIGSAPLIAAAADDRATGDVVVVAQKVVSKAEGRRAAPGRRRARRRGAVELAGELGKDPRARRADPRRERARSSARERGVLIVETRHGLRLRQRRDRRLERPAAATVALLPETRTPRRGASAPRSEAARAGGSAVIVTDSFGRAWRRRPGRRRDRLRRARRRSTTGAAAPTGGPRARGDRDRHRRPGRRRRRPRPRQDQRTPGRRSSAASAATSRRRTAPARGARRARGRGPLPLARCGALVLAVRPVFGGRLPSSVHSAVVGRRPACRRRRAAVTGSSPETSCASLRRPALARTSPAPAPGWCRRPRASPALRAARRPPPGRRACDRAPGSR